ncbi:MAG: SMK killer toxin resistance protein [Pycnora praestabilis]|nr:MAG: SMK killer toxin resistance protein [Pycnora praestabilis]
MSSFLTNLFTSIFTPGPTPTLILATNISFAALQLILLALFIATYSIHFVILSALSAGLWGAINWFVRELGIAKEIEERKRMRERREAGDGDEDEGDTEETEGEGFAPGGITTRGNDHDASEEEQEQIRDVKAMARQGDPVGQVGGLTSAEEGEEETGLRKRRSLGDSMTGASGEMSTDSEWEKVEDDSDKGR